MQKDTRQEKKKLVELIFIATVWQNLSEGSKNGPFESFLAFIIPPVGERNA